MGAKLVSAVEWWKKGGKWICSLICYDGVFSQLWLESDSALSFEVQSGRYCIGHTLLSSRVPEVQVSQEPWKAPAPCPSRAILKKGHKCPSCYQADLVHHCLICDGTKCLAEPSIQKSCHKATAYVYIASFSPNQVKVGVAHNTRIPRRWVEQGANLAKRIIIGNGMEVRRYEKTIHNALNVLSGLRTSKKVDTLWKRQNVEAEIHALARTEEEIKRLFPEFPSYRESVHDLSAVFDLPELDRRPIELKVKTNLHVSGEILGVKGSLLLLKKASLPFFLNLKHLLGRKIELKKSNATTIQTALDRFE